MGRERERERESETETETERRGVEKRVGAMALG